MMVGCDSNTTGPEPDRSRGDIISSTSMSIHTIQEIRDIWVAYGMPDDIDLSYSCEVIKVVYQTIDYNGDLVQASGALLLPIGGTDLSILSLQHGTRTQQEAVGSSNIHSIAEGELGLYIAAAGYLVCLPDYLGFGVSDTMHPYVHSDANTPSIIDFIRASKTYSEDNDIILNDELFLGGFSEGGYLTLATQKEIEENYSTELNITAVAPMAGPYDLAGTAEYMFQTPEDLYMGYMGYIFTAYNEIYGWNKLDSIFHAPYASIMNILFGGYYNWLEVLNQLPDTFFELFKQDFVTGYLNGNEAEIQTAFNENTLLDWSPETPIRFYHSNTDEIVPYQNSVIALENLSALSTASIELVTIEDLDHESSALVSLYDMLIWFNSF